MLKSFVKIKSKNPRNPAVNKDTAITISVNEIVCFFVGQLTCFNSPRVLFRYSINDILFWSILKPLSGLF